MADATTPNYGWPYPTPNADADTWGMTLNNTIVAIDAQVKAVADVSGVKSVAGHTGVVTLAMADITDQRIGTARIFVQSGGSPPAMNNGDICVIV